MRSDCAPGRARIDMANAGRHGESETMGSGNRGPGARPSGSIASQRRTEAAGQVPSARPPSPLPLCCPCSRCGHALRRSSAATSPFSLARHPATAALHSAVSMPTCSVAAHSSASVPRSSPRSRGVSGQTRERRSAAGARRVKTEE
ncbi:hypothetical protein BS78_10G177500 [Paspalum vaginatum]|nr:hypothetical protein BS78_10G177500 [Paspalum vaginatum]